MKATLTTIGYGRSRTGGLHVKGLMKLSTLTLPFEYHTDPTATSVDHDAILTAIEERGNEWEARHPEFLAFEGKEHAGAVIVDCRLYPESHDDWHLVCHFTVDGVLHTVEERYATPNAAPPLSILQDKVAAIAAEKATQAGNMTAHAQELEATLDQLGQKQAQVTRATPFR